MLALISLFIVLLVSFIVVRVAAVLLELTGLSEDVAMFQALSAFSGTGFTTKESENLVVHSSRRRIIQALIIMGNAGFTTSLASLILTFNGKASDEAFRNLAYLLVGLIVIFFLLRARFTYTIIKRLTIKVLKRIRQKEYHDYHEILGLGKGFVISKIHIIEGSWMINRQLKDLKLDREGTLILSIEKQIGRKREFIGAPNGKTIIDLGDVLTCYGKPEAILSLPERDLGESGDRAHEELVEKLKHE